MGEGGWGGGGERGGGGGEKGEGGGGGVGVGAGAASQSLAVAPGTSHFVSGLTSHLFSSALCSCRYRDSSTNPSRAYLKTFT